MNKRLLTPAFLAAIAFQSYALAGDWITAPSYFTHDPQTGERVRQYSPIGPFYTFSRGDYRRSGYRHTESSIQYNGSADRLHIVEEWGGPVRPYGEWEFPFRPYAVPYELWGPPWYGYGWSFFQPWGGGPGPGHPGGARDMMSPSGEPYQGPPPGAEPQRPRGTLPYFAPPSSPDADFDAPVPDRRQHGSRVR
jgi:hypothetical protein